MTPPQDETIGVLETVHTFEDGPMPTGVSVSATGRVFVNYRNGATTYPSRSPRSATAGSSPFPTST